MTDPIPADLSRNPNELAHLLEPVLLAQCEGRLSDVRWFRTDWQRGGAATAFATWSHEDGNTYDAVVKLPVGPTEYIFTACMHGDDDPTPGVLAHGMELGGYDMAWLVIERLPGDPLSADLHKKVFLELAETVARFYRCAIVDRPVDRERVHRADWIRLIEKARDNARENAIPDEQEWNNALKDVLRAGASLVREWDARPITCWCHGDLHPGNVMMRDESRPWGEPGAVLLDMAEVHAGHWVEDAVYLERLYWSRPDAVKGVKPVQMIAKARKNLGLATDDDYTRLAHIRRLLMASCVPAFLQREGAPSYLAASLRVIQKTLPLLA